MKPLLIAALAVLLTPAAALAQVAAATVPNSFERPAAAAPVPASTPAPVQATPAAPPTPANPRSEELLRTLIGSAQSGAMDYALMTDDLAAKFREQATTTIPLITGFGAIQAVDFVGARQGADLYVVTFEHQATQWLIGVNADGKVALLLFRPAE